MFSLIISMISIALVVLLALATLYYGGTAFGSGAAKARATQLVNEVEQLRTAIQLFQTDNNRLPASFQELLDGNYLKDVPNQWTDAENFFTSRIGDSSMSVQADTCLIFNQNRGIPFVPSCSDELYRQMVVCCSTLEIGN